MRDGLGDGVRTSGGGTPDAGDDASMPPPPPPPRRGAIGTKLSLGAVGGVTEDDVALVNDFSAHVLYAAP